MATCLFCCGSSMEEHSPVERGDLGSSPCHSATVPSTNGQVRRLSTSRSRFNSCRDYQRPVAQQAEHTSDTREVECSNHSWSTKQFGRSSAWSESSVWNRVVVGSNPTAQTNHTVESSLMAKPRAVTPVDVGSSPSIQPKQRVDSSTGRASGSYPEGCEVDTRSIHQCPVAQREERRSYKAEAGGASEAHRADRRPSGRGGLPPLNSVPGDQF